MYQQQNQNTIARMMDEIKKQRELAKYRENQKSQKMSNGLQVANNTKDLYKEINTQTNGALNNNVKNFFGINNTATPQATSTVAQTGGTLANGATTGANALSTGAQTATQTGSAASASGTAGSTLGSAMPVVGGALNGAQAANDARNGDYIGAGLNGVAAGASFVPVYGTAIAMGAKVLDSINKMVRSAQDKANQEALKKANDEATTNNEISNNFEQDKDNELDAIRNNQMKDFNSQSGYTGQLPDIHGDNTPNLNDNTSVGINTPNDIQTPQNEPYTNTQNANIISNIMNNLRGIETGNASGVENAQPEVPQWLNADGSSFDAPTTKNDLFNYLNGMEGADKDAVNNLMFGLNNGSKDNAQIIDEYNKIAQDGQKIYIPQTQEEIDTARQSVYDPNQVTQPTTTETTTSVTDNSKHPIVQNILNNLKQGVGDLYNGYQDNVKNDFAHGDLARSIGMNAGQEPSQLEDGTLTGSASEVAPKSIMNRIGEAVGTAQRVASNPYVQGVASYALNRANGVDNLNSVTNAINWAGNKAKSDYYQQQINPGSAPSIMGNYNKDDYNAKTMQDYRNASIQNTNRKVSAQVYNNALKELDNRLNNNMIDPKTYDESRAEIIKQMVQNQLLTDELPTGKSQISNNTIKTNSAVKKNDASITHMQNQDNIGYARVGETSRHNKVSEGQSAERIKIQKQNANINQGRLTLAQQKQINKTQQDKVNSGSHVKGITPNGKTVLVPVEKVQEFVANGGKV